MSLYCNVLSLRFQTTIRVVRCGKNYLQTCQSIITCSRHGQIRTSFLTTSHSITQKKLSQWPINNFLHNETSPESKSCPHKLFSTSHEEISNVTDDEFHEPHQNSNNANDIINCLLERNLERAEEIFNSIETPSASEFSVMMRFYAMEGKMKECFGLFEKMKKQNISISVQNYTNLITSIVNHNDSRKVLKQWFILKNIFYKDKINLNDFHYNAMMKICIKHGIKEGIPLYSEMRYKNVKIKPKIFHMMMKCIQNEDPNGMKLSVCVWQTMRKLKILPDLRFFNYFFANVENLKWGDMKVGDPIVNGHDHFEVRLTETGISNLLADPPTICKFDLNKIDLKGSDIYLNDIHEKDKFLLLGGFEQIFLTMEEFKVKPNILTFIILIKMAPNSDFIENMIINKATQLQIPLNISFFNVLIKKRCYRFDYESAKNVIKHIETFKLCPNLITWYTLALSCHSLSNIEKLLYQMEKFNFLPDEHIFGIFITNFLRKKSHFKFVDLITIMSYMTNRKITPTTSTLIKIDAFTEDPWKLSKDQMETSKYDIKGFRDFIKFYSKWKNSFKYN